MGTRRLQDLSDDELSALSWNDLLDLLDPGVAEELRQVWARTANLPGDWADELIADRREQAAGEQTQAR